MLKSFMIEHGGEYWPQFDMSALESLRLHTTVVADTGDFAGIVSFF